MQLLCRVSIGRLSSLCYSGLVTDPYLKAVCVTQGA